MNLVGKIEKLDSKHATVFVQPASACGGHCGSCGGCSQEGRYIKIKNNGYRIGQWLEITINDNQAFYALIITATIILALLITGYYLATYLFPTSGETPGIIGAIVGILIGAVIVKLLEPVWQKIEYDVKPLD